jgi:hypothetical protein
MSETVCETPIYDALLGERASPDVSGELIAHNWEIFGLLSNMTGLCNGR